MRNGKEGYSKVSLRFLEIRLGMYTLQSKSLMNHCMFALHSRLKLRIELIAFSRSSFTTSSQSVWGAIWDPPTVIYGFEGLCFEGNDQSTVGCGTLLCVSHTSHTWSPSFQNTSMSWSAEPGSQKQKFLIGCLVHRFVNVEAQISSSCRVLGLASS